MRHEAQLIPTRYLCDCLTSHCAMHIVVRRTLELPICWPREGEKRFGSAKATSVFCEVSYQQRGQINITRMEADVVSSIQAVASFHVEVVLAAVRFGGGAKRSRK